MVNISVTGAISRESREANSYGRPRASFSLSHDAHLRIDMHRMGREEFDNLVEVHDLAVREVNGEKTGKFWTADLAIGPVSMTLFCHESAENSAQLELELAEG